MSLEEKVPGMRPGDEVRNTLVGFGYFIGALVAIVIFPILVGIIVGTNYRGMAEKASKLPGIEPDGGLQSGAMAGMFTLVLWILLFGAGGETNGDENSEMVAEGGGVDDVTDADAQVEEPEDDSVDDVADADAQVEEPEADEDDASISQAGIEREFVQVVESEGVEIREAKHEGNEFVVRYTSYSSEETGLVAEFGTLAGGYAGIVYRGHGGDGMTVYLYDLTDTAIGEFYVNAEWAEAWAEGEMSDEEYFGRVGETIVAYGES